MTVLPDGQRSKGQVFEGIAFTFCKCATVALLLGPYALPGAALLAATFYVLAYSHQQRESRCVLRYPLWIAAFWVLVAAGWVVLRLWPAWIHLPGSR